jgi:hypothetical protein
VYPWTEIERGAKRSHSYRNKVAKRSSDQNCIFSESNSPECSAFSVFGADDGGGDDGAGGGGGGDGAHTAGATHTHTRAHCLYVGVVVSVWVWVCLSAPLSPSVGMALLFLCWWAGGSVGSRFRLRLLGGGASGSY